jgi:tetratricopeptide (TPR) repeat protein
LAVSLALAIAVGFFGILWQWNQAESGRLRLRAAIVLEERGSYFRGFLHWDDALDALDEAIALCPELSSAWEQRGQIYVDLGLWELALQDRHRAFELAEPVRSDFWWTYGTLLCNSGDLAGYRRLCSKMQERFRGHSGGIAVDFVRTVCLKPIGDVDYQLAAARLQDGEFHDPLYLYAQGLIFYRAGQFKRSATSCSESLRVGENWSPHPLNFPVLALAYDKLGDADNARRYLDRASQARESFNKNCPVTRG